LIKLKPAQTERRTARCNGLHRNTYRLIVYAHCGLANECWCVLLCCQNFCMSKHSTRVRGCIAVQVQLPKHTFGMKPYLQDLKMILHLLVARYMAWSECCQLCESKLTSDACSKKQLHLRGCRAPGFTDVFYAEELCMDHQKVVSLRQPSLNDAQKVRFRASTQPRRWVSSSCA
jgi:hypothetical protein